MTATVSSKKWTARECIVSAFALGVCGLACAGERDSTELGEPSLTQQQDSASTQPRAGSLGRAQTALAVKASAVSAVLGSAALATDGSRTNVVRGDPAADDLAARDLAAGDPPSSNAPLSDPVAPPASGDEDSTEDVGDPSPVPTRVLPGELLEQMLNAPTVAVARDTNGNRCVAGGFSKTVVVGQSQRTSNGARDIFVTRWSGATLSWTVQFGNTWDQLATGVAMGPDSSCVIAGLFQGDLELGAARLHSNEAYPNYSAFVAQVSYVPLVFSSGELTASAVPSRDVVAASPTAAPVGLAPVLEPVRRTDIFLNEVSVSKVQVVTPIAYEPLPPGATVGVSVDAAGQPEVEFPPLPSLSINQGPCPRHYTFPLCIPQPQGSRIAPRRTCLTGLDAATGAHLTDICLSLPQCCSGLASSNWSAQCVSAFSASSGYCGCRSPEELANVAPGQSPLPRQSACCNEVTQAVCGQDPSCCNDSWGHVCASYVSPVDLACTE